MGVEGRTPPLRRAAQVSDRRGSWSTGYPARLEPRAQGIAKPGVNRSQAVSSRSSQSGIPSDACWTKLDSRGETDRQVGFIHRTSSRPYPKAIAGGSNTSDRRQMRNHRRPRVRTNVIGHFFGFSRVPRRHFPRCPFPACTVRAPRNFFSYRASICQAVCV